ISSGDGQLEPAQELGSDLGKIIRIDADGTVPGDTRWWANPEHATAPSGAWMTSRKAGKPRVGGPGRTRTYDQGMQRDPPFAAGVDYLFTRKLPWWGAGRSSLSLRALKLSGSLCTFRRCTAGLAQGCRP